MNIAIIALTDYDKPSSTVRRVHMIGKGLIDAGHNVHIIVPQRFSKGLLIEEIDGMILHWGVQTSEDTWNNLSEKLRARWKTITIINQLINEKLDWLIMYNLGMEAIPILILAKLRNTFTASEYCDIRSKPSSISIQEWGRFIWQTMADGIVPRFTDLNLTISRFLENWLKKSAPRTFSLIIPPLVDTDLFSVTSKNEQDFRKQFVIQNAIIIAYLGSYWYVEGVKILIQAFKELVESGENVKLLICGEKLPGRICDDVPQLVEQLQLKEYVIMTGWLTTENVIAAMSASDILVVPKIEHEINQAGVPTKLAEYCAAGRAIVATSVGDIPLYLTNNHDAILCPPDNPSALASSLYKLIHNPDLRYQLGQNSRKTALKHFDYRSAGQRIDYSMSGIQKLDEERGQK